jgi:hypothetical protein
MLRERERRQQWSRVNILEKPRMLECLRMVADLTRLDANWDGHGSAKIQSAALSTAVGIMLQAPLEYLPMPHVCPVSGGSVGLHWRAGERELELTVLGNGAIEYLAVPGQRLEDEASIEEGTLSPGCAGDVGRWLQWLIEA